MTRVRENGTKMPDVIYDPCLPTLRWLSEASFRRVPAGHPRRDHVVALVMSGEAAWHPRNPGAKYARITDAGRKRLRR